jgi:alkanesulfonate monooxygenase SsuD/methylene tetrahydromethanopterin reductase-like flavin-dependent oxidoreductase (luciferase family)
LVRDVRAAEEAGFDFSVSSDHYQPWLEAQGHAGYAWSILGAAAQATDQIPLNGADHQKPFFEWAEKELLSALREL